MLELFVSFESLHKILKSNGSYRRPHKYFAFTYISCINKEYDDDDDDDYDCDDESGTV